MPKKYSIIILSVFLTLILLGGGCKNAPKDQQIDYKKDVKELIKEVETSKKKVRGSCDQIAKKSHCIDFVGSVYTEQRMKLSCSEGKFSKNTCPYSNNGGCRATEGTVAESIIWSYDRGGNPMKGEELQYEIKACNSLPIAKWITPEDFFKKDHRQGGINKK
jgi:hypothetical protein